MVIFAIGRMSAWITHWWEQYGETGGQIARPRQVYAGPNETEHVPIAQR